MISENLEKISIDISESSDTIVCTVEIVPLGRWCRKKIYVDTNSLVSYLKQQGIKFVSDSLPHKELKNYQENTSNKGTWTFLKKKVVPRKRTTRKKTTTKK